MPTPKPTFKYQVLLHTLVHTLVHTAHLHCHQRVIQHHPLQLTVQAKK